MKREQEKQNDKRIVRHILGLPHSELVASDVLKRIPFPSNQVKICREIVSTASSVRYLASPDLVLVELSVLIYSYYANCTASAIVEIG